MANPPGPLHKGGALSHEIVFRFRQVLSYIRFEFFEQALFGLPDGFAGNAIVFADFFQRGWILGQDAGGKQFFFNRFQVFEKRLDFFVENFMELAFW